LSDEDPRFGFEDIASTPPARDRADDRLDQAAAQLGFVSREPLRVPPKRRLGTKKQLHPYTMKLDIDDAEKFIRWAERERLTYREAFGRLVALIDRAEGPGGQVEKP
jgi:hypothetical protein